jgi:hypothetical protein
MCIDNDTVGLEVMMLQHAQAKHLDSFIFSLPVTNLDFVLPNHNVIAIKIHCYNSELG